MEILWKGTANRPKPRRNCVFPQNFDTRKLGEITAFYAVYIPGFNSRERMFWSSSVGVNRNQRRKRKNDSFTPDKSYFTGSSKKRQGKEKETCSANRKISIHKSVTRKRTKKLSRSSLFISLSDSAYFSSTSSPTRRQKLSCKRKVSKQGVNLMQQRNILFSNKSFQIVTEHV